MAMWSAAGVGEKRELVRPARKLGEERMCTAFYVTRESYPGRIG